jgi:hypothetical protein
MATPSEGEAADSDFVGYARSALGPLSADLCRRPEVLARLAARRAAGATVEDAVLAEVHAAAKKHRGLANEFFSALLPDLGRLASRRLSSNLQRHLGAGDVLQSVTFDLWKRFTETAFTTKAAYLRLITQRLTWKASDRARQLARRPPAQSLESLSGHPRDGTKGPMTIVIEREQRERLLLVLIRLPKRDRLIITRLLKGDDVHAIARLLALSVDSAARAIRRTTGRARHLLGPAT